MQVGSETCLSARLAIYADGEPEPKVEEVQGTGPQELIHRLCTGVEAVILPQGGILPQPAIRALIENLIHCGFRSVTISVLDSGRTLRVADRGQGIDDKERAVQPGFSTADAEQRRIIAGVGSGLTVAASIAESSGGRLEIADNLGHGTVVTLSFGHPAAHAVQPRETLPERHTETDPPAGEVGDYGKRVLLLVAELGGARIPTICDELRISATVAGGELDALVRRGLLDPTRDGRLALTPAGLRYLDGIFVE